MNEEWDFVEIGDVLKTTAGGTPLKANKEYYEGGKIPWLLSGEVGQKEIFSSSKFITQAGLDNSSAKIYPPNSVLVAMYGATAGEVGILRFKASSNQAVCAILPDQNFLPKFLYYSLLSKQEELISRAAGNAQPNISQAKIKTTKIPNILPSKQKQIVEVLDVAFDKIERLEATTKRQIEDVGELFSNYLNIQMENTDNDWIEGAVSDLASFKHGFAFKSVFFEKEGDFVLLTPGNFYEEGGYRDRGHKQKYYIGDIPEGFILSKNDFLVAMTEQAEGLLGSSLIVPEDNKFLHNQRLGLAQIKEGMPWVNEFFFHVFNSRKFRKEIHDTGTGAKVRHTSPKKIGAAIVRYPSTACEQKQVSKSLDELAEMTEKLKRSYLKKLIALSELRQSLLHKAFAGELVDMDDNASKSEVISIPANDNHTDHAGAIAYADSYFRNNHAESFKGKTTYEKVVQAAENIAGIDLGRQAIQWKRGPTDNQQRDVVEALAAKEGYFSFVSTGGKGFKLERGRKFNELRLAFEQKFQDQIPALDRFLRVIGNLDTQEVEVLSTVHTAWNNYIISGQTPTDEQIVSASREGWHEEKEKITRNKFFAAIQTLRDKNLIPTGQGKYVGKVAGQSFDF